MISKIFTAMCMLIGGCNAPRRGVMVVHDEDHYVVSLLNCGSPKWDHSPVWEVNVGKYPSADPVAVECRLVASFNEGDDDGGSFTQWRYGSQPKGYVLKNCAALETGATYEVNIFARPVAAHGHFKVESNGDVTMIDGPCRK